MYLTLRNVVWHVSFLKSAIGLFESNGVRCISWGRVIVCFSESNSDERWPTTCLRAWPWRWTERLTQIKFVPRDAGVKGWSRPVDVTPTDSRQKMFILKQFEVILLQGETRTVLLGINFTAFNFGHLQWFELLQDLELTIRGIFANC